MPKLPILALFLSTAAHASPVILPPPEFDHPFEGREIVEFLPLAQLTKACRHSVSPSVVLGSGMYFDACSWTFADGLNAGKLGCHILLPVAEDVGVGRLAQLKRHEDGHCNHWGPGHPDGHYEGVV